MAKPRPIARVVRAERLPDDPADVVFAQNGGVELVRAWKLLKLGARMVRQLVEQDVARGIGLVHLRIAAAAIRMDHRNEPLVRHENLLAGSGGGYSEQLARPEHRLSARGDFGFHGQRPVNSFHPTDAIRGEDERWLIVRRPRWPAPGRAQRQVQVRHQLAQLLPRHEMAGAELAEMTLVEQRQAGGNSSR